MTARTGSAEAANELQLALASDDAFEAWYRRTLPRVYAYVLSRCANDVSASPRSSASRRSSRRSTSARGSTADRTS